MKGLRHILSTVRQQSPILYVIVLIHFVLMVVSLAGIAFDERSLMGVNVWIKPLKFTISGGIYILTLGYLITLYPFSNLKKHIIRNLVSWTLLLEIIIIVLQGARGVQSHYNQSNAVDGFLFGMMGLLIAVNVLIMVLFIIETIRLKLATPRPVQWAILLGWSVVLFGSWVGGQMIGQMAHNVGVADGGAGLPILNWSTVAGDLRVAHFFGLHGIQIIPLFAIGLQKLWPTRQRHQILVVVGFGLIYAGWIAYTFYQAKQGMPFIAV